MKKVIINKKIYNKKEIIINKKISNKKDNNK